MTLLGDLDQRPATSRPGRRTPSTPDRKPDRAGKPRRADRPGQSARPGQRDKPERKTALLVLLLLTCATVITLDYRGGADSPVEPAREAVGEVLGPVEAVAATAMRPFTVASDWLRTSDGLRGDLAAAQAENAELRSRLATSEVDRNRLEEYDAQARAAKGAFAGHTLVSAHVVAHGPGQSFSRTVTIDAGTRAGVTADLAVVTADGLVGRVIRATSTTATVLLVVDGDSVVGGRLGRSMEVGFLRGRGQLDDDATLRLDLVDDQAVPAEGDSVVAWGSEGGAPYLPGIPIGRVSEVVTSPRQQSAQAVVEPFVDFSSLDLVAVVVPGEPR